MANPPIQIQALPQPIVDLGFDGRIWSTPQFTNSIFFASYDRLNLNADRRVLDLNAEVKGFLKKLELQYGKIGIYITDPVRSAFVIRALRDANVKFKVFDFNSIRLEEFENWFREFAVRNRCPNLDLALSCWTATQTDLTMVLDTFSFTMVDLNVSSVTYQPVGPKHWNLLDFESEYRALIYLVGLNRPVVGNILKASDSIFSSFLLHELQIAALSRPLRNNLDVFDQILDGSSQPAPQYPPDSLRELEKDLKKELRHEDTVWYTPLHKVAPWLRHA
jgi:hypothetical protein